MLRLLRSLPLKDIISKYIDHQKEVIIRRTRFDLEKAEKRVHILEGLKNGNVTRKQLEINVSRLFRVARTIIK